MGTYVCKQAEADRKWVVVDAAGQTLGRLSTHVARVLMGKHRPTYTPHADTGDPGGLKEIAAGRMLKTRPTRVIEWSVKGMLPKGSLGRRLGMKLKVYAGPQHPHEAQKPESFK